MLLDYWMLLDILQMYFKEQQDGNKCAVHKIKETPPPKWLSVLSWQTDKTEIDTVCPVLLVSIGSKQKTGYASLSGHSSEKPISLNLGEELVFSFSIQVSEEETAQGTLCVSQV